MSCMNGHIGYNPYSVQCKYWKDTSQHSHQDMSTNYPHIRYIGWHCCIMNMFMGIPNMQSLRIDKIQVSRKLNIDLLSHIVDSNHNMLRCIKIVPVDMMCNILLTPNKLHMQNRKIHTNHWKNKFLVHSL